MQRQPVNQKLAAATAGIFFPSCIYAIASTFHFLTDYRESLMSNDPTAPESATAPAQPAPAASPQELQQKYRQFLELMPLTLALAGLPASEGRLYSEDQIEGRAMTIRTAHRVARNTVREVLGGS
jgi:hypothetical protein